jgi:hypothetical protein
MGVGLPDTETICPGVRVLPALANWRAVQDKLTVECLAHSDASLVVSFIGGRPDCRRDLSGQIDHGTVA